MARGYSLGALIAALKGGAFLDVGTTANTLAAGDDARFEAALKKILNGADIPDKATFRNNLNLGTASLVNVGNIVAENVPSMAFFELAGNTNAGYFKLPNGVRVHWGTSAGQVVAGQSGAYYWDYPFPNVCLMAIVVPVAVAKNQTAGNVVAGNFSWQAVELHNWGPISAGIRVIGIGR